MQTEPLVYVTPFSLQPVKDRDGAMIMLECSLRQSDPDWVEKPEVLTVNECYTCYVVKVMERYYN